MIAARLSITGFTASHGYVRGFLKRYDICNITMHGQAGGANLAEAAAAVEDIRRKLESYPPDRVYNMDDTGLLYKCLPSRSYVPCRDRRLARGSKAMRNIDRVTLLLCTNATGTHKLPVTMIGSAARPLCFRGEGNECPLPYFDQKKAWMDKHVYEGWWNNVFLPAVRHRHRGAKCALIMDNSSTHDVALSSEDVEIFFLPPNLTAVYQPMDAGVIAALKRRYKNRILAILVRSLPAPLVSPPPTPQAPPPPPSAPPHPRPRHLHLPHEPRGLLGASSPRMSACGVLRRLMFCRCMVLLGRRRWRRPTTRPTRPPNKAYSLPFCRPRTRHRARDGTVAWPGAELPTCWMRRHSLRRSGRK